MAKFLDNTGLSKILAKIKSDYVAKETGKSLIQDTLITKLNNISNNANKVEIAEGTTNGAISVTTDGGAAQSVKVHGLGTAAYKAEGDFATAAQGTKADTAIQPNTSATLTSLTISGTVTNNTDAATKKYVDDKVSTAISTTDAMVFKGTLGTDGTVETLPTSDVKVGDTYKVITADTYDKQVAKVGDLFIAQKVEDTKITWVYVPSGDEEVTTIAISTTNPNVGNVAQTGAVTLGGAAKKQVEETTLTSTSDSLPTSKAVATYVGEQITSNKITVTANNGLTNSGSGNTITIGHENLGKNKTSGLYKITVDDYGHVTAAVDVTKTDLEDLVDSVSDVVVTNSDSSTAKTTSNNNSFINFLKDSAKAFGFAIKSGDGITVSNDASNNITIKANVKDVTTGNGLSLDSGNVKLAAASASSAGAMSSDDFTKLSKLAEAPTGNGTYVYKVDSSSSSYEALEAITEQEIEQMWNSAS